MADTDVYDRLANVLKDINERFPEDGFVKHQRLRGLLADHLPGAEREIKIALDAIDEGVVNVLTESSPAELGMQIDRLVMRLDSSRGIREDIARQVVQAFAYALNYGELPSTSANTANNVMPPVPPSSNSDDAWVGVSEAVNDPMPAPPPSPPPTPTPTPTPGSENNEESFFTRITSGSNRYILIGVAVIAALILFSQPDPGPQPQPNPQPQPGPQPGPQPSPQPGPGPQPMPGPKPQPSPQPQPQPSPQPSGQQQMWYDDYGNAWQLNFSGTEFSGYNGNTASPARGMAGMLDNQSGAVVYQIYDASNQPIAEGQGQFTDQTHINFMTMDAYGNLVGQGQMHVNHRPQ